MDLYYLETIQNNWELSTGRSKKERVKLYIQKHENTFHLDSWKGDVFPKNRYQCKKWGKFEWIQHLNWSASLHNFQHLHTHPSNSHSSANFQSYYPHPTFSLNSKVLILNYACLYGWKISLPPPSTLVCSATIKPLFVLQQSITGTVPRTCTANDTEKLAYLNVTWGITVKS